MHRARLRVVGTMLAGPDAMVPRAPPSDVTTTYLQDRRECCHPSNIRRWVSNDLISIAMVGKPFIVQYVPDDALSLLNRFAIMQPPNLFRQASHHFSKKRPTHERPCMPRWFHRCTGAMPLKERSLTRPEAATSVHATGMMEERISRYSNATWTVQSLNFHPINT